MIINLKINTYAKLWVAFTHDLFWAMASFFIALYLRFDSFPDWSVEQYAFYGKYFVTSTLIISLSHLTNGLYKGIWRFSSTHDLIRIFKGTLFGISLSLIGHFLLFRTDTIPRSFYFIQALILIFGLGGGRLLYRLFKERILLKQTIDQDNVLVVGAGSSAEKIIREVSHNPNLKLKIVGIVDDDPSKYNRSIHDVKIVGPTQKIEKITRDLSIKKIFIAMPSANGEAIKRIYNLCTRTNCEIKIIPKYNSLFNPSSEINLLRNVKIEDLLGRQEAKLDSSSLERMIQGKIVLVSGAGGSIGREICRQILKFAPVQLIALDLSEYMIYTLGQFLQDESNVQQRRTLFTPLICDIRNQKKLEILFEKFHPQLVFHAAAYKHVPIVEENPDEAVLTNIFGTLNLAKMAQNFDVENFTLISTDKAVNPTNIMGATKRVAEMCLSKLYDPSKKTKFSAVRFGNVLESSGSVIPLFKKQIEERRNLTVTHPDITRYFMSIPEASGLVLQATNLSKGNDFFVLDMGKPVRIKDLAIEMIKIAGLELGKDIDIDYIGLRPGEKLFEELFYKSEEFDTTEHQKIMRAKVKNNVGDFDLKLNQLYLAATSNDTSEIVILLKSLVQEFNHLNDNYYKEVPVVETQLH